MIPASLEKPSGREEHDASNHDQNCPHSFIHISPETSRPSHLHHQAPSLPPSFPFPLQLLPPLLSLIPPPLIIQFPILQPSLPNPRRTDFRFNSLMSLMNQSNVSSQGAFDFICARFVFFEAVGDLVLEIVGCSAGGAEVEDAEEEGGFGVEGWWHGVLFCFVLFCSFVALRCVALRFFCSALLVLWWDDNICRLFLSLVLGWVSRCFCCLRLMIHVCLERVDHIRHDGIDFCCVHTSQFMLFLYFPHGNREFCTSRSQMQ